jgi:hypothetical protein
MCRATSDLWKILQKISRTDKFIIALTSPSPFENVKASNFDLKVVLTADSHALASAGPGKQWDVASRPVRNTSH